MCKADIAFLLNPSSVQAPTTPERAPMSPSTYLSPITSSPERSPASFSYRRCLVAPYMAPLEKRRSDLRCYGNSSNNKRARPSMSMAALCSECFSSSDDEQSDASSTPVTASATRPRKTHTPPERGAPQLVSGQSQGPGDATMLSSFAWSWLGS
ncbi:uncharacterized protein KRP23_4265 [Phytophthora ramorum]|uniref:uncharacterized protein n=1 Tax=Phytophthora ramorum TaxID=164328 RepID=UPI0030A25C42|nr:hypothetical protein KRP23_4265 [Phytophthora ramorum]